MNQFTLIEKFNQLEAKLISVQEALDGVQKFQFGEIYVIEDEELMSEALIEKFCKKRIDFLQPFKKVPKVIAGFNVLDLYTNAFCRIGVHCENVDQTGFNLLIKTWHDSKIIQINVFWFAFAENK